MNTNLPPKQIQDSAIGTRLFFDSYGDQPLEFRSVDVDTCIGFFTNNGFENDAAVVISTVLLKQAKIENIPISRILDTMRQLDGLQLSAVVTEILNNNRSPSSTLGFRKSVPALTVIREIRA